MRATCADAAPMPPLAPAAPAGRPSNLPFTLDFIRVKSYDGTTAAMIEVELDETKPFDRVVLAEPTWLGQRVKKFRVSVPATPSNNHRDWVTLAEGTTIGHKRIVRVPETKAKQLRVEILDSRACPALTTLGVHRAGQSAK